jgi:hypothetical protein
MKSNIKKIVFVAVLVFSMAGVVGAQTQTGQAIITWHANNFYPSDYEGKPLATQNTSVSLSVAVVRNGKPLDLSQATITWYVDEKFLNEGKGLTRTTMSATKTYGDQHLVRVRVLSGNDSYESSINLPIAKYQVVVPVPLPNQAASGGAEISLQAVPYFFNANTLADILFSWQVNGENLSGNDSQLNLKTVSPQSEAERTVQINVLGQNQKNALEFSRYRTTLNVY